MINRNRTSKNFSAVQRLCNLINGIELHAFCHQTLIIGNANHTWKIYSNQTLKYLNYIAQKHNFTFHYKNLSVSVTKECGL